MARASLPVELYGQNNGGDQRRFTVADGIAITKGDLLVFTDARLASRAIVTGGNFAGIASMDKVSSDGSTSVSCWENGIFEMTASGAIDCGARVKIAAPGNYVMQAVDLDCSSMAILVGIALETAADGEVINVRVLN